MRLISKHKQIHNQYISDLIDNRVDLQGYGSRKSLLRDCFINYYGGTGIRLTKFGFESINHKHKDYVRIKLDRFIGTKEIMILEEILETPYYIETGGYLLVNDVNVACVNAISNTTDQFFEGVESLK